MTEDINKKLDTIVELLNKIIEKQSSTISFGNYGNYKTSTIDAIGKEYNPSKESNFPTPWNSPNIKPNKLEDELYD